MSPREAPVPDPSRRLEALDLLCDHATGGLDQGDQVRLMQRIREFPDLDPEEFERTAAVTHLALLKPQDTEEDLPPAIRERVLNTLRQPELAQSTDAPPVKPPSEGLAPRDAGSRPGLTILALGGWLAAASLLVWPSLSPSEVQDPETARAALVDSDPGLVQASWRSLDDPAADGVDGDVIWSGARQEGFMRFVGLPRNDPRVEQYQLWIFDPEQDEATPIDGGVFDIDGEEALVPIDAKLPAQSPTAFAVTIEKPGGVVVSRRERLILLAPVEP